ncbi:hypothetical protein Bbelb_417610 [Branchiostoma belcheri]|nr:hypothetical protein Bbelb_417610 [Branchiostoma belcheri]
MTYPPTRSVVGRYFAALPGRFKRTSIIQALGGLPASSVRLYHWKETAAWPALSDPGPRSPSRLGALPCGQGRSPSPPVTEVAPESIRADVGEGRPGNGLRDLR